MNAGGSAGETLSRARRNEELLAEFPGGLPDDEPHAYAIQAQAIEAYADTAVGYKIGATSEAAQSMLGTDHPFVAPLLQSHCHEDGFTMANPGYGLLGIEAEFAFQMGADLPSRPEPYTIDEVKAAVASVHPAFEIVGLRVPDDLFLNILVPIADFGANVAFVAGAGTSQWQVDDLSTTPVTVDVGDERVATGSGADVLGNPLNALFWLANDRRQAGGGLTAGEWITTGACAGLIPIGLGQTAIADFGSFGTVTFTLSA